MGHGDLQHIDGNGSGTRFRFKGSEELENGMTAGVNLELGVKTGSGSGTSTRHAAVDLSGAFGKLTVGHTSEAADGMAHADNAFNGGSWLGGVTNWCSYHSTASGACPSQDGGRMEMLRYDTPALGDASVSLSTADDERWSSQLKVKGSMGEAGYAFRIGYIGEYDVVKDEDVEKKGDIFTTSAGVSFGQGTSIGGAWSRNDMPNSPTAEKEYYYLAVDQSYGDGSVGVYWKQAETSDSHPMNDDVEGTLWGIGWGHTIGSGVSAYAGFRHIEEDKKQDINLYLAGMRVTFN